MPKPTTLLVAVPLLVLAACGMKGDLYEAATPPAPTTTTEATTTEATATGATVPEPAAPEPAAPAEVDDKGERKTTPRTPDPAVAQ